MCSDILHRERRQSRVQPLVLRLRLGPRGGRCTRYGRAALPSSELKCGGGAEGRAAHAPEKSRPVTFHGLLLPVRLPFGPLGQQRYCCFRGTLVIRMHSSVNVACHFILPFVRITTLAETDRCVLFVNVAFPCLSLITLNRILVIAMHSSSFLLTWPKGAETE